MSPRNITGALTAAFLVLMHVGDVAQAQDPFPSRPIELIVPYGEGGGADQMARHLGRLMEPATGVRVVVRNVPGASGNAALTRLLGRAADGHTMATLGSSTVTSWAFGVGYVKPEDLQVLAIVQQSASMLFVRGDSPFRSFEDLLAFAKENPGGLSVATSGQGGSEEVALHFFAQRGYRMFNVPYANPEQRYAAPFNGRTQALYEEPGDVARFLATKQLRPLVVFDVKRHAAFAAVPTAKELGYDVPHIPNLRMFVVPATTPPERSARLARALEQALSSPEWKQYCVRTYSCTQHYTGREATERMNALFATVQKYLSPATRERP